MPASRRHGRLASTRLLCNAELGPGEVRHHCRVETSARALMKAVLRQLHPSARDFHRVLKPARTTGDLAGAKG